MTEKTQGRVVISPALKRFAGIEKNVVIVGCGNIAEIWAAEKWEEINSEDNLASVAELMDEYGL